MRTAMRAVAVATALLAAAASVSGCADQGLAPGTRHTTPAQPTTAQQSWVIYSTAVTGGKVGSGRRTVFVVYCVPDGQDSPMRGVEVSEATHDNAVEGKPCPSGPEH